jgi:GNAT superfamily N-acetyltransferase
MADVPIPTARPPDAAAEAPAPRLRPGTLDDNHACFEILRAAVNDLARRIGAELFGEDDPEGTWRRFQPFADHLTRTAAEFWVAEAPESGVIIGFARSIDRNRLFELTEFFVSPDAQAVGIGRQLLERAFPLGRGEPRVIIATIDLRALSRYFRSGVVARVPIASFTGTPRSGAERSTDFEIVRVEADDEDFDPVDAIDGTVLGHLRTEDHRWFRSQREGYLYHRGGEVVGYGYVGLPDGSGSGPFAVLDPADLPAAMAHAESRRAELGASDLSFEVPLNNGLAIDYLLARGYRMDQFLTLLLTSEPMRPLDGYLFTGPPLIL